MPFFEAIIMISSYQNLAFVRLRAEPLCEVFCFEKVATPCAISGVDQDVTVRYWRHLLVLAMGVGDADQSHCCDPFFVSTFE